MEKVNPTGRSMMRCNKSLLVGLLLILSLVLTSCGGDGQFSGKFTIDDVKKLWNNPTAHAEPNSGTESDSVTSDTITIASWNIKWLSHKKASNSLTGPIITQTLAQFDIIAIQEIRDTSDQTMNILKQSLADLGYDYNSMTGLPLPEDANYRERYAFIYNTATIEQVENTKHHVYPDTDDDFDREPYSAHFKAKNGPFDFILVSIHTAPKKATDEIKDLTDAIADAKQHFSESDIITVGDYNADCKKGSEYYDESQITTDFPATIYTIIIPNSADTNLASTDCTYDRIIITKSADEDYASGDNSWGVYHFDTIHNLTYEDAKKVSDHYPVWAQFMVDKDTD